MLKLYTPEQIAKELGVCRKTIYRMIADGSLPTAKISRKNYRITEEAFQKFVNDHVAANT